MRIKNCLAGILLVVLMFVMTAAGVRSGVLELPKKMAHNIYMDPVLEDGRDVPRVSDRLRRSGYAEEHLLGIVQLADGRRFRRLCGTAEYR